MGDLPDTLPIFLWPEVPLNLETLKIILRYSAALAVAGLLESLMTATIADEMTDSNSDSDSDKNRECKGLGTAKRAVTDSKWMNIGDGQSARFGAQMANYCDLNAVYRE